MIKSGGNSGIVFQSRPKELQDVGTEDSDIFDLPYIVATVTSFADHESIITVLCTTLLVHFQIDRWFVDPIDTAVTFSGACPT